MRRAFSLARLGAPHGAPESSCQRVSTAMRITSAKTFTVGNPWKNWVFVRLETDEGIFGVGEGTANAFAETIAAAIAELEDTYIGLDPTQVELLV